MHQHYPTDLSTNLHPPTRSQHLRNIIGEGGRQNGGAVWLELRSRLSGFKSQLGHFLAKAGFFPFLCLGSLLYKMGVRRLS